MTRVEAIKLLNEGKMVTHPELAMLPIECRRGYVYYLYNGKALFAGKLHDFFAIKQNNIWDSGWVEYKGAGIVEDITHVPNE
jgi:hypothetical protein